jgi:hypothetical protein
MYEDAINPITNEINWDCPCFNGRAYGPCGELFRKTFTLFVQNPNDEQIQILMIQLQKCIDTNPND